MEGGVLLNVRMHACMSHECTLHVEHILTRRCVARSDPLDVLFAASALIVVV